MELLGLWDWRLWDYIYPFSGVDRGTKGPRQVNQIHYVCFHHLLFRSEACSFKYWNTELMQDVYKMKNTWTCRVETTLYCTKLIL